MSNMQALVDGFPDLSFNHAMAVPFLSGGVDAKGEQFQQALEAAKIVGRDAPHLRLVDPAPQDTVWESSDQIPNEASGVLTQLRFDGFGREGEVDRQIGRHLNEARGAG